jgi:hypothetical protein
MRFEVSSRLQPCNRPRVPPRGAARLPQGNLWNPPGKKGRPRSIPSRHLKETRLPLSVNTSSTIASPEMPVTTSMSTAGANVVTVQLGVTTSTGAGVTIAPRIAAHHPSHQALESLARPFKTPSFQSGSAPRRLSPSITARPNPNFGSLTSAWLVSWAAPPMTK